MKRMFQISVAICISMVLMPFIAYSAQEYTLVIKDHMFSPAQLTVPADKKIKLTIENQDPTKEEFESYDLNREEVVEGHGSMAIYIGPLKPGRYEIFGDFNPNTAKGVIIAQ